MDPQTQITQLLIRRRRAAILAADVAGYSRLMGANEEQTLKRLDAARTIMDSRIRQHGGRIANTAGDSVIAEFASAVAAVRCAVEVQTALGLVVLLALGAIAYLVTTELMSRAPAPPEAPAAPPSPDAAPTDSAS
jgi:class 3 adenylate cyclase